MNPEVALDGVTSLFLDTPPIIYLLEGHPKYISRVKRVLHLRKKYGILLVTSPITLAECLVHPIRFGSSDLGLGYQELITSAENTRFAPIGEREAILAARIRSEYKLPLADSFQVAVAISSGCEAILTNDQDLKRIQESRIIVIDDLVE
ncbi:MAG: PIN domain-containing protein [Candidatus Omnitrophica bacterium]|nr:PIN domain-containing protein [Candidatus Omnitrophota bacterium]